MTLRRLALALTLIATAVLAFGATTASSGATAQPQLAAATTTTQMVGTLSVRFTINKFVKRGNRLWAVGSTVTQFKPTAENAGKLPTATTRKAFATRVIGLRRLSRWCARQPLLLPRGRQGEVGELGDPPD